MTRLRFVHWGFVLPLAVLTTGPGASAYSHRRHCTDPPYRFPVWPVPAFRTSMDDSFWPDTYNPLAAHRQGRAAKRDLSTLLLTQCCQLLDEGQCIGCLGQDRLLPAVPCASTPTGCFWVCRVPLPLAALRSHRPASAPIPYIPCRTVCTLPFWVPPWFLPSLLFFLRVRC